MKAFEKKDLRSGMRIVLRNGESFIYIDGFIVGKYVEETIDSFYPDFTHCSSRQSDVKYIYEAPCFARMHDLFDINKRGHVGKILFRREIIKDITFKEAIAILKDNLDVDEIRITDAIITTESGTQRYMGF